MTDGDIFNTITNGKGQMLGYGYNITIDDRWRIVMYIRALQRSQNATLADASPEEQAAARQDEEARHAAAGARTATAPRRSRRPAAPAPRRSARDPTSNRPISPMRRSHSVSMPVRPCRAGTTQRLLTHERPSPHRPHPAARAPRAGKFPLSAIFAGLSRRRASSSPSSAPSIDHVQFAYSWFFALLLFLHHRARLVLLGHAPLRLRFRLVRPGRRVWENILGLFPRLLRPLHAAALARAARRALEMDEPRRCTTTTKLAIRSGSSTRPSSTSASSSTSSTSSSPGSTTAAIRSCRTRDGNPVLHPPDARPQLPRARHLRPARDLPRLRLVHGPRLALGLQPLRRLQLRHLRAGQPGRGHRPHRALPQRRLPAAR